jgi:hypothetical protein
LNVLKHRVELPRRAILKGMAASAVAAGGHHNLISNALADERIHLIAKTSAVPLRGNAQPSTPIWGYNDRSPGPILRVRQGDELRVRLINQIEQPTSLHWHDIRIVNAMGVGAPGHPRTDNGRTAEARREDARSATGQHPVWFVPLNRRIAVKHSRLPGTGWGRSPRSDLNRDSVADHAKLRSFYW